MLPGASVILFTSQRHHVIIFLCLHYRLFDWRPERPVGTRFKSDKVVILKNMFKPSDFDVSSAYNGFICLIMKSDMNSAISLQTATIFFLTKIYLKQGIG